MIRPPRLVAFLRAINVGGHTVAMQDLRKLFVGFGYSDVETFIASGNVIFSSEGGGEALQETIEKGLHRALGYEVATFVRTLAEVDAIARLQTFKTAFNAAELEAAPTLCVGFLTKPLSPPQKKTLMAMKTDIDDFAVIGREVYWLCKKKQSESTFTNVRFEKAAGTRATFRGINTLVKLSAKYPPL